MNSDQELFDMQKAEGARCADILAKALGFNMNDDAIDVKSRWIDDPKQISFEQKNI